MKTKKLYGDKCCIEGCEWRDKSGKCGTYVKEGYVCPEHRKQYDYWGIKIVDIK